MLCEQVALPGHPPPGAGVLCADQCQCRLLAGALRPLRCRSTPPGGPASTRLGAVRAAGRVPVQRLGRSRLRVCDLPVRLHRDGHPAQPRRLHLLHLSGPVGQIQEGGTRGSHAQVDPHPQRGNLGPCLLATASCANGHRGLTFNTVAEQLP